MITTNKIKHVLSFLVIIAISYFFWREFQKNWELVQSFDFKINIFFVFLAVIAVMISYLINTYGWYHTVNTISQNKIGFIASFAIFNTCYLTKYIPGKVWSLATQMYCLERYGISKSLVLFINIITLYISIISSLILGISYLVITPSSISHAVTVPFLVVLVIFQTVFINYCSFVFNRLLLFVNKLFKRDIKYFEVPIRLLLYLHAVYLLAALSFGMGAYLLCFGIGFQIPAGNIFPVMSSLLISEVVGVLAVIVPGGLGVREGVMYLQLKSILSGAITLVLPLASRLVNMLVDVSFGAIGLLLLKSLLKIRD